MFEKSTEIDEILEDGGYVIHVNACEQDSYVVRTEKFSGKRITLTKEDVDELVKDGSIVLHSDKDNVTVWKSNMIKAEVQKSFLRRLISNFLFNK